MFVSRLRFFLVVTGILFSFTFVLPTEAAIRDVTPAEADQLKLFGINSTKIDDSVFLILNGGCDVNPYQVLLTKYRGGGGIQIVPQAGSNDGKNLRGGINPSLACRLVKFFEYAEKQGCRNIKITSAYRSAQQQEDMCGAGSTGCAPPGRSCHQYGLAVDISSSCTGWMRSYLGTKNPGTAGAKQFKLHFPYSGDHIQCIENTTASCGPSTQGCDGTSSITPDLNYVQRASPTAQLANAFRQALGQPTLPPQPQLPPQPLGQQQSPLNAFGEPSATLLATSSTLITTASSSVADRLEALAFGVTATATQGATSVPLVITGDSAAQITSSQQQSGQSTTSFAGGSPIQQTFTSQDLGVLPTASQPNTRLLQVLATLRQALVALLQYLRPFALRSQMNGQTVIE